MAIRPYERPTRDWHGLSRYMRKRAGEPPALRFGDGEGRDFAAVDVSEAVAVRHVDSRYGGRAEGGVLTDGGCREPVMKMADAELAATQDKRCDRITEIGRASCRERV